MSLDLCLQEKCHECGHFDDIEIFSITYNLSPMWYLIYPDDNKMIDIDGMTGKKSLKKLDHALYELVNFPEKFIPLNPSNGWGSYDGLLDFIHCLREEAKKKPKSIWISWR